MQDEGKKNNSFFSDWGYYLQVTAARIGIRPYFAEWWAHEGKIFLVENIESLESELAMSVNEKNKVVYCCKLLLIIVKNSYKCLYSSYKAS